MDVRTKETIAIVAYLFRDQNTCGNHNTNFSYGEITSFLCVEMNNHISSCNRIRRRVKVKHVNISTWVCGKSEFDDKGNLRNDIIVFIYLEDDLVAYTFQCMIGRNV